MKQTVESLMSATEQPLLSDEDLQDLEVDLLLTAVSRQYGFDFSQNALDSLKRRILFFAEKEEVSSIAQLIPLLLHDRLAFERFLEAVTVNVSTMFRDPEVFKDFREMVVPKLKTYSAINIWHAGCATGEEVYTMAVLLAEEGLLERARLYATDLNKNSLAKAKLGIFPVESMQEFSENYIKAGGRSSLSDFYCARYDGAIFDGALRERITFAQHNLACDGIFAEMNVVMCRNVLIYFNQALQNKAFQLFRDSLVRKGFMILGNRETLQFASVAHDFEPISKRNRIFRKLF